MSITITMSYILPNRGKECHNDRCSEYTGYAVCTISIIIPPLGGAERDLETGVTIEGYSRPIDSACGSYSKPLDSKQAY